MNVTLVAYLVSALIGGIFTIRLFLLNKDKPTKMSSDFFYFFLFGSLYFFVRFSAIAFFMANPVILSLSYPVSHIFLYLSFSLIAKTSLDISKYSKYSNIVLAGLLLVGTLIVILNFMLPNVPHIVDNGLIVDWGTNKIISISHFVYGLAACATISITFIKEALKTKDDVLQYFLIGMGFFVMPLSILKNLFDSEFVIAIFEFNMIFGVILVASGFLIKKVNV